MNPSEKHQRAADRVLLYLKRTQGFALEFGGGDDFIVASNASFADNTKDRKSSQGYIIKLFGSTIGWQASKQSSVSTLITEAELLSLSEAAREGMFIGRLIKELGVSLDDNYLWLQCDNTQTIRLINAEIALLRTLLRHIDIHHHWLRQEAIEGRVKVEYTPSAEMIADGLTKALQSSTFNTFRDQLGLKDLSAVIEARKLKELDEEAFDEVQEAIENLTLSPAPVPGAHRPRNHHNE